MPILEVPISRFELTLPGRKTVRVSPTASVMRKFGASTTRARVHVPMADKVSIAWSEALPVDAQAQLRANSETYHTFRAEEGVLFCKAIAKYELTRGAVTSLEIELPAVARLNRVRDSLGAVRDWRASPAGDEGRSRVTVFLDRPVTGELSLELDYDVALGGPVEAPLIHPLGVQRERGMLALLSGAVLTVNPIGETEAVRVGANQLPSFVRDGIDEKVAHTFKYHGAPPTLRVEAAAPEKEAGKFDAQVDTLISIGEASVGGSASVQLSVKTGSLSALRLRVPRDVHLLNLTAPSLRTYTPREGTDDLLVDVEFTQEMTGQFRLELAYERVLSVDEPELDAPLVGVEGAEVEQGRIAVEALSALEVRPAVTTGRLATVENSDLPRQLVLRTSNPILLAFKYVRGDAAPELALGINRHRVLGVQEATIDHAHYRSLFTREGLRVTRARFAVRNDRKQFLRIDLPSSADVWSASVNGRPVKPALADPADSGGRHRVLLKIINSTEPFPVELTYATTHDPLARSGKIEGKLPRPDILVTRTRWDVFLPAGPRYAQPSSNMEWSASGSEVAIEDDGRQAAPQSLQIAVPAAGILYTFDKLYANQGPRDAWFALDYRGGRR